MVSEGVEGMGGNASMPTPGEEAHPQEGWLHDDAIHCPEAGKHRHEHRLSCCAWLAREAERAARRQLISAMAVSPSPAELAAELNRKDEASNGHGACHREADISSLILELPDVVLPSDLINLRKAFVKQTRDIVKSELQAGARIAEETVTIARGAIKGEKLHKDMVSTFNLICASKLAAAQCDLLQGLTHAACEKALHASRENAAIHKHKVRWPHTSTTTRSNLLGLFVATFKPC